MSRFRIRLAVALGVGSLLVVLTMPFAARAQSLDAVADLASRINRERVSHGLVPYALNPQLTTAAQLHANDLARTGKYRTPDEGHIGSDRSSVFDRVARAGYGTYSWGRRLGENWARYFDVARAFTEWMLSEPHRNNILHPLYREIGIGIAPATEGGFVYIIDFGAQPNVLPVFINDLAAETRSLDVVLTLSDEQVMPNGDGASSIGHLTEVQISNSADFAGSKWQPYAMHLNWSLTSGAGTKIVYVKYRDAKGRTAIANDSIFLTLPTTPSPSPTRTLTPTPRPTLTAIATPSALPTSTPSATPTQQSTDTPTVIPTNTATTIPATPSVTPSPTGVTASNSALVFDGSTLVAMLGFAVVIVILFIILKDIIR